MMIYHILNHSIFGLHVQKYKKKMPRVISSFCHEADENFTLLGYCAASSGNSMPKFRDNQCDRLSQNID